MARYIETFSRPGTVVFFLRLFPGADYPPSASRFSPLALHRLTGEAAERSIPFLAPHTSPIPRLSLSLSLSLALSIPRRPFLPRSFALVTLQPSCNPKTLRLVWFSTWYQPLAPSPLSPCICVFFFRLPSSATSPSPLLFSTLPSVTAFSLRPVSTPSPYEHFSRSSVRIRALIVPRSVIEANWQFFFFFFEGEGWISLELMFFEG